MQLSKQQNLLKMQFDRPKLCEFRSNSIHCFGLNKMERGGEGGKRFKEKKKYRNISFEHDKHTQHFS